MSKTAKRRVPMVIRISGTALLVAALGGQIWQQRPVGLASRALLSTVALHCPAAAHRIARPTIADGAHTLDRWGFRVIADAVDPQPMSRCGSQS